MDLKTESSIVSEHGRDLIVVLLFVASTVSSWLIIGVKKGWSNLVKRVEALEIGMRGSVENPKLGLDNRMAILETKCEVCSEINQDRFVKRRKGKSD